MVCTKISASSVSCSVGMPDLFVKDYLKLPSQVNLGQTPHFNDLNIMKCIVHDKKSLFSAHNLWFNEIVRLAKFYICQNAN